MLSFVSLYLFNCTSSLKCQRKLIRLKVISDSVKISTNNCKYLNACVKADDANKNSQTSGCKNWPWHVLYGKINLRQTACLSTKRERASSYLDVSVDVIIEDLVFLLHCSQTSDSSLANLDPPYFTTVVPPPCLLLRTTCTFNKPVSQEYNIYVYEKSERTLFYGECCITSSNNTWQLTLVLLPSWEKGLQQQTGWVDVGVGGQLAVCQ